MKKFPIGTRVIVQAPCDEEPKQAEVVGHERGSYRIAYRNGRTALYHKSYVRKA